MWTYVDVYMYILYASIYTSARNVYECLPLTSSLWDACEAQLAAPNVEIRKSSAVHMKSKKNMVLTAIKTDT